MLKNLDFKASWQCDTKNKTKKTHEPYNYLGSLHTQAKSRDHEIVRTQKKVSQGHPKTPPISCSVVMDLKCIVKSYVTGSSTKCYFNEFLFIQVLTHDKIEWTIVSVWSATVSRFCVRPTSKSWFWKYSKWLRKIIHLMPCKNPCKLYIHLAFTYSIGPSSIVWCKPGPAPPLAAMRVLEVYWSRAFSLVCEVALKAMCSKHLQHIP
jgi:hypothetical protein